MLRSAHQTPNVGLERLASLPKENAFADEDMIVIQPLEDAKMSMNAWPVPNLFVDLMQCAKTCLEAMNANVHLDTLETLLAGAKSAQEDHVLANLPMFKLETSVSLLDAVVTAIASLPRLNA